MDQVRIRAAVNAHGMRKHQEATVAETPVIAGGIKNGAFILLERIPLDSDKARALLGRDIQKAALAAVEPEEALHAGVQDETPVPPIEDLELPDLSSTDDGETPATEYQPRG